MLLLNTQTAITNQNAPTYVRDPDAEAVLALGPTAWLEGDPRFVSQTSGQVDAWIDRVSGRRYLPGSVTKPSLVTSGASSALRFLASPMVPEGDFDTFTEDGTHTLVVLFRVQDPSTDLPTPGGYFVGSNGGSHNYMNTINYPTGGLDASSGGVALNGLATNFQDGEWHLEVLSVPSTPSVSTTSKLYIDGVEAQAFTGLKPPPAAGSRRMTIGGYGPGAASAMLYGGDIGGIMYIPRRAVHLNVAELNALHSYWLARKAERV